MCRPEIPINWEKVDELLIAGCLGTEIAGFFGIHHETFYDRVVKKYNVAFSEYSAKKKATGQALIRFQQYAKAMGLSNKGDNTLLIWLGKQRLGQREAPLETEVGKDTTDRYLAVIEQLASLQSASLKASSNSEVIQS